MDCAVLRFWEDTHKADAIIWAGFGLRGTRLDWTSEDAHVSGNRVAEHAILISGGIESSPGLMNLRGGMRCVAEEREKRRRDKMVRKRMDAIIVRSFNGEVGLGFNLVGFL